jgi:hypothetical protein
VLDVRVPRWSDEAVPPDCVRRYRVFVVVEANQAGLRHRRWQFSGIVVGTIVTVLTFAVLTPNAEVLGTDQLSPRAASVA